ncbi:hypothetical protein AGMMS50230_21600 [Spirochaetia bacterium]|nr:hypothetical protein AGMMS50230_21600 [Spirochaetia bacterium]
MKFKAVIVFFNILIVFFVLLVFVLPLAILGKDMAGYFWQNSWLLLFLVLGVLFLLDLYFAVNYRIYVLLEREDWPALVHVLEDRVLRRGRYTARLVKLLATSYLVMSDAKAVTELEKKLTRVKKGLLNDNVLVFGAARLLCGDNQGAAEFFSARLSGPLSGAGSRAEWVRWYLGFSLFLSRQFEAAADTFMLLCREGREGVLTALSAYFLNESIAAFLPRRTAELRQAAGAGKERVRQSFGKRAVWDREIKRIETEVHAAVLVSYLGKAADYIYRN